MSAIKVNGTWKQVSSIKIKKDGAWQEHSAVYARLEGAWHLIDLGAEPLDPAYHVWKAYADDELGTGITLDPTNKHYLGLATGQRTEKPDLSDPSVFDWSLIKGEDGEGVDQTVLDQIQTTIDGNTNRVSTLENTTATNANRLSAVETETGSTKNRVSSLESTTSTQASRLTAVETKADDINSKVSGLETTTSNHASRISAVEVKSNTTAGKVGVLETATSNNASRIETVKVQQDNAVASAIDTAKAYTDTETGVLKAERVIKADANGKVSGIHLLANGSGAEAGGKMYFQADEIAIVPPNWNAGTEADKSQFPFYFSEDRKFMYLDEATIKRLSAETIDSGSLAVDGLTLLSNNLSLPAGTIRDHMIDPSFKDGLVRINPDATIQGGTKSVSSKGIATNKKIIVPPLESGGSAQTMTLTVVGPNEYGRKDVQFDLEMRLNGAPHNFSNGQSKIRLSSTITYTTEDEVGGEIRVYRSSFNYEDQVILPAPTKGNQYTYEFIITNMSFSPSNTSVYNFADKLQFSVSVSEPTVSSGGFITNVNWGEIKEKPPVVSFDMSGSSSYPRIVLNDRPAGARPNYLRIHSVDGGLLPYSNGGSYIGTDGWRFREIHAVNFYEKGTALVGKYAAKAHGHTGLAVSEWGGISSKTAAGEIYLGPANTSHAHIYTDRPDFYFNKKLLVLGNEVWHRGNDSSLAKTTAANLFTATNTFAGVSFFKGVLACRAANGAYQRADARDNGSLARIHKYGISTTGGTSNFREAWYDGANYINLTASAGVLGVDGAVNVTGGLRQNGHAILNGSDTWLRTSGTTGIYFATYSGGLYMTDSTYVRVYNNRRFQVDDGSSAALHLAHGGITSALGIRRENKGSSWISQRDTQAAAVFNDYSINNSAYAAVLRQRHSTTTYTVGGLGNAYFGFFSYYNNRTSNGTDGYFRMDVLGNCVASGNITARDLIATSDRRVKSGLRPIDNALSKVGALQAYTYQQTQIGKRKAGVIAQDVQSVLPEAVSRDDDGYLQVSSMAVIGLLANAVKELKAKVEKLEGTA